MAVASGYSRGASVASPKSIEPHEFRFGIADDVGRIDVAVDHAFVVNRLQRLAQLDRHREFLLERQVALPDQFAQRVCVHVFEQDAAVVFGQFDRADDVRARQRLVDGEFVVITGDRAWTGGGRLQRLDDDRTIAQPPAMHERAGALVDAPLDVELEFSHGR